MKINKTDEVTITMNVEEAALLRAVMGAVSCLGSKREIVNDFYYGLTPVVFDEEYSTVYVQGLVRVYEEEGGE